MKITGVGTGGTAVEVVKEYSIETTKGDFEIRCGNDRHRITFENENLILHDHTETEIIAGLLVDDPRQVCPCIRIKLWLPQGIFISH